MGLVIHPDCSYIIKKNKIKFTTSSENKGIKCYCIQSAFNKVEGEY